MKWTKIAEEDSIDIEESLAVEVEGKKLALHRTETGYFVTDNICTHQYALLSDGYLEDDRIECPLHQAQFCIKTGKALSAPATVDIGTYEVKTEDGNIYVAL